MPVAAANPPQHLPASNVSLRKVWPSLQCRILSFARCLRASFARTACFTSVGLSSGLWLGRSWPLLVSLYFYRWPHIPAIPLNEFMLDCMMASQSCPGATKHLPAHMFLPSGFTAGLGFFFWNDVFGLFWTFPLFWCPDNSPLGSSVQMISFPHPSGPQLSYFHTSHDI